MVDVGDVDVEDSLRFSLPVSSNYPYNPGVQTWELDRPHTSADQPQVLRDESGNRVITVLLAPGESLPKHREHEHALVLVTRGLLQVCAGRRDRTLSSPSLIHLGPGEHHGVRALTECHLVLSLTTH
jgi:quercetin dioxygenase-like cupin family protein